MFLGRNIKEIYYKQFQISSIHYLIVKDLPELYNDFTHIM